MGVAVTHTFMNLCTPFIRWGEFHTMYSKSAHTTFKICRCGFQLNFPIFQGHALLLSAVLIANIVQVFTKYIFQMQLYFLLAKVVHSDIALLRKPLKRYMRREISNATRNMITFSCNMWHPLFLDQAIFEFPTSIFNQYHKKIVSAHRKMNNTQNLYTAPHKRDVFEGNFCLCVKKVMRALVSFSSLQVMV